MQQLNLTLSPRTARPSDRRQIDIDYEIDDRLTSGEVISDYEANMVSEHHWQLLRHSGVRRCRHGWRMPNES